MTHIKIIGIWGPSGSGKSTLSDYLCLNLDITRINEDDYFFPPPDSCDINQYCFDQPESLRLELLADHLESLSEQQSISIMPYDMVNRKLSESINITPKKIILVEGRLFPLQHRIQRLMSYCYYLDTPLETCMTLRAERDATIRHRSPSEIHHRIEQKVIPSIKTYLLPNKHLADAIIKPHEPGIYQQVLTHIQSFLTTGGHE